MSKGELFYVSAANMEALIGQDVTVLWNPGETYHGRIQKADPQLGQVFVKYGHCGEQWEQWEDIGRERIYCRSLDEQALVSYGICPTCRKCVTNAQAHVIGHPCGSFYHANCDRPFDTKLGASWPPPAWTVGLTVDAQCERGVWYEASVVEADVFEIKVHYKGWGKVHDKWISPTRIAPVKTYSTVLPQEQDIIVDMENVSTILNSRVTVRRNEQEEYSGVLQEVDGCRAHIKYDDGSGCVWEDINLRKIRRCAPSLATVEPSGISRRIRRRVEKPAPKPDQDSRGPWYNNQSLL